MKTNDVFRQRKNGGFEFKKDISGSLSFVKEYVKEHVVKIRVTVRSLRGGGAVALGAAAHLYWGEKVHNV